MSTADGTPKRRRTVSLFVRLLVSSLFVMVLVESHSVRSANGTVLVFALDVSDSIPTPDKSVAYVIETVHSHRSTGKGDQQSLVVFGKNSAVELAPSRLFPFEAIESDINRGATNLEQALTMSAAVIPQNKSGRIALVSDGVQTEGDLSHIIPELQSRGIAVDVLPVEYSYDHEVWLEELVLPQVKPGETGEAHVVLSSLTDGRGKLSLRDGETLVAEIEVDYRAGKNSFSIPVTFKTAGYHQCAAAIEVTHKQDGHSRNNVVFSDTFIRGIGGVLMVTDIVADRHDVESLEHALKQAASVVEIVHATALPSKVAQLAAYDTIIFCNVSHDEFETKQLQAVHDAVVDHAVGFLMIGGVNSFGFGGYRHTAIGEILPVEDVPESRKASRAVAVILDTTRIPDGNAWGKRMAKIAIKTFRANDKVGILCNTDQGEQWLVPMIFASDYEAMVPVINQASISATWDLRPMMELGLAGLQETKSSSPHLIIVTDGSASPPSPALIQKYIDAKVSVSTIMLFPRGGLDLSKMQGVSEVTGGRYYFPDDANLFSRILDQESKMLRQKLVSNRAFVPSIGTPSDVIAGLAEFPELQGHVPVAPKRDAVSVLNVEPDTKQFDALDPLLVIGRSGLGRTAAFTSNVDMKWGSAWQEWDRYPQFIRQLLAEISRSRYLQISTQVSSQNVVVTVDDVHPDESKLVVEARILGPNEKLETMTLSQIGPRRYQAKMPLWGQGRYRVFAVTNRGHHQEVSIGGFGHVSTYTPEHLQLHSNRVALQEIAFKTGGRVLAGDPAKDDVYAHIRRTYNHTSESTFDWFLIALVVLLPIDWLSRRVWKEFVVSWEAVMSPNPAPPSPTMIALLQTKQWVATAMSSKGTARMLIQLWAPLPKPSWKKVRAATTPKTTTADEPVSESAPSTIEKLLVLKRQQ